MEKKNYIGERFFRLTVVSELPPYVSHKGQRQRVMLCKCACHDECFVPVRLYSLVAGLTKSCGCWNREASVNRIQKHGMANKHPLYTTWKGMRQRCYDKKSSRYNIYGGRGIFICDEWRNDFRKFYEWAMSHGWEKGLTIDRIDNDDIYKPENCRIVTYKENNENRKIGRNEKGQYISARKDR